MFNTHPLYYYENTRLIRYVTDGGRIEADLSSVRNVHELWTITQTHVFVGTSSNMTFSRSRHGWQKFIEPGYRILIRYHFVRGISKAPIETRLWPATFFSLFVDWAFFNLQRWKITFYPFLKRAVYVTE